MDMQKVLALPRSLILNIKLFGVRGGRCPLLISNSTKCKGLRKGTIEIENFHTGAVTIGFGGVNGIPRNKGTLSIGENARLIFEGEAHMASGTSIRIDKGSMTIGDNFSCNNNCFLSCTESVNIGKDVLLGWNINIRDSDGHTIFHNGQEKPSLKPVTIGNHVWIASYADILKGTVIPDDCVVGYRSCVNKRFDEPGCIIAGFPAQVVQRNIEWKR